jgi:hypothetical protein
MFQRSCDNVFQNEDFCLRATRNTEVGTTKSTSTPLKSLFCRDQYKLKAPAPHRIHGFTEKRAMTGSESRFTIQSKVCVCDDSAASHIHKRPNKPALPTENDDGSIAIMYVFFLIYFLLSSISTKLIQDFSTGQIILNEYEYAI